VVAEPIGPKNPASGPHGSGLFVALFVEPLVELFVPWVELFVEPLVELFVEPLVELFVEPLVALFVKPWVVLFVEPFVVLFVVLFEDVLLGETTVDRFFTLSPHADSPTSAPMSINLNIGKPQL
jgi:hypothetical protein